MNSSSSAGVKHTILLCSVAKTADIYIHVGQGRGLSTNTSASQSALIAEDQMLIG
jgi:hypothetical protein